jgi:hypothetical protein
MRMEKRQKSKEEFPKVKTTQAIRLCRKCYQRVGEYHLFSCEFYQQEKRKDGK